MKIATWNVNSLKVRLLQVLQWLKDNPEQAKLIESTLRDELLAHPETAITADVEDEAGEADFE